MSLKERIETHLATLEWVTVTSLADPRLRSLLPGQGSDYRAVVAVRYAGQTIFDGFRRPTAAVVAIVGQSQSSLHADGQGIEDLEDDLVGALNQISDCYPELLPTEVIYDYRLPGQARRGVPGQARRGGGGDATYIALTIPVLGA